MRSGNYLMQRQGIYKEGSSSVSRDKRSLEGGEDEQPERKRPALASVIIEALKVDSLQKLCSSLEPILRRVVSEEVERALAKLGPAKLNGRSSPKMLECPHVQSLQLHFRTRLSLPLFTGGKVEGEQGALIHVVLVDANTDKVVPTGPEASAKLDVVVLEGDFNNEDDEEWTQEEFESHVVKEREGKRPLLTGDLQVTLKEGVGTLGELTFTDNSSWIRSRKFRLGLRISSGICDGIRIREAKTEAFTVKDHRGELYKKHYPPALNDDVWRLEKIGKDGAFHKKLNSANIFTVEDFLRLVVRDPQKLRNILGSGMSNKMWDALVEHAKTCVLSGKHYYVYHPEDARNIGVVFNNIYELAGLIVGEQYYSADSLSDSQKDYVDSLVKKAYENWDRVIEYDGKSLLAFEQNKRSTVPQNELLLEPIDYSIMDNQLALRGHAVTSDQQITSGPTVEGYSDNRPPRYPVQSQMPSSNSPVQYDGIAYVSNNNLVGSSQQNFSTKSNNNTAGLALVPPQASTSGFQTSNSSIQQSTLSPFDEWSHSRDKGVDEFFNEDEIRLRSHEMLENEDMQQLLRLFTMGGHSSINLPEDPYSLSSFMPSPMPSFDEDRSRPGKAVVGWLKIKAAMRWGFFIRKKAAEKRAQLVELEDE